MALPFSSLDDLIDDFQFHPIHNDPKDMFCTFPFFENITHKDIAHQRKFFQNTLIFLVS